ncbi:hypothetical protein QBC40DRAFT_253343 [Triangularia verruculosa]|uniref:Uncharacterized protein n=1 Tax=Triangularia verruculosa TaxID=2587418 RepID=A0AAN7AU33_9PEZI|nr:hypothetical protein QBC40DRAFT_253343 [Triangularia verruculosa]
MKLFSFLISTLLFALAASQVCTFDDCRNRIVNYQTATGRAFCFTFLTPPVNLVTRTSRFTALATRTSTSIQSTRTVTTTATGVTTVVRRQILPTSVAAAISSACSNSAARISSACSCYLNGQ